eukprot:COSAG02_NODE_28265_length_592_cov_4.612576_2_plen_58_part_00
MLYYSVIHCLRRIVVVLTVCPECAPQDRGNSGAQYVRKYAVTLGHLACGYELAAVAG